LRSQGIPCSSVYGPKTSSSLPLCQRALDNSAPEEDFADSVEAYFLGNTQNVNWSDDDPRYKAAYAGGPDSRWYPPEKRDCYDYIERLLGRGPKMARRGGARMRSLLKGNQIASVALFVLISVCGGCSSVQPTAATVQPTCMPHGCYTPGSWTPVPTVVDRGLSYGDPCDPPCWERITPGVSSADSVVGIFDKLTGEGRLESYSRERARAISEPNLNLMLK
jgi:hypothetical protein